jgi:heat shock protein HslJ
MKSKHIITMSSRKLLQQVFGLTLVVLLLAGCGRAPAGPTITSTLEGTEWALVSLNGDSLIEGTNITLNFAEGILSGFAGCNAYGGGPDSGPYTATDEGALTIPQIAVTMQRCLTPEGVIQQELAYIETLRNAAAYRVMDDRLEIDNAAGETTLIFARKEEYPMDPSDLVGTRWQLLSMNGSSPIVGSTITIAFAEGEISGHAGCRGYRGTYEASGDDIKFPWLEMTGEVCIRPEALLLQEGQYTDSLGWATNYRLSEEPALSLPKGQLEIFTARGEVLVFGPLPESADTSQAKTTWALTTFIEGGTTTPLLAEAEITVTFEDGTVSGSAGCNAYSAAYTFDGSFFTFETPAATEMACSAPAGIMEQEQRYLDFLEDVTVYRIKGNQLRLETGDGRALVFTAQE